MRKLLLPILLSLLSQPVLAAFWDRPSLREPFMDGVEAMIDSMRDNPPSRDGYYRYGNRYGRFNWLDPDQRTPFPSNDPWLDDLPLGNTDDSPFFRISPTAQIRGRWLGQYGDGLWIKSSWIRFYNNDDYRDAKIRVSGSYIYVGFEWTRRVIKFEYAVEDDILALRDTYGRTYLYQRFEEDEDSSNKKSDSDD